MPDVSQGRMFSQAANPFKDVATGERMRYVPPVSGAQANPGPGGVSPSAPFPPPGGLAPPPIPPSQMAGGVTPPSLPLPPYQPPAIPRATSPGDALLLRLLYPFTADDRSVTDRGNDATTASLQRISSILAGL